MQLYYSGIEAEIVERLSPLNIPGVSEVLQLPEVQAEHEKAFPLARIVVAYHESKYGEESVLRSGDHVMQEERVRIEIVFSCKRLRGETGLHSLIEKVKNRLLGFTPTDCMKMYLVSTAFKQFDQGSSVWSYSLMFETRTMVVEILEDPDPPLPTLQQPFFAYTGEDEGFIPLPPPPVAYMVDSDGVTVYDVPVGTSFACTLISPSRIHNSDDSVEIFAGSGEDVPIPDVAVTLADGIQTFRSLLPINLSNYYPLALPTGTRVPVNVVSSPSTETAWLNSTANLVASTGAITKIAQFGFNARANFMIPTLGDFQLDFQLVGSDTFAGVSFIDISTSYNDIAFAISVSGTSYYLYEAGISVSSFGGASPADVQRIVRSNGTIKYYINGVLKFTQPLASSDAYSNGYMMFDCSIYSVGSKVQNIQLTYL